MFGSDSFNFETPNVIDPGDLPPSRPRRSPSDEQRGVSCNNSHTASTHSDSDDEEYHQARESSARLLRDINDLDLSPRPYDPYEEEEEQQQHSLPSVEQARTYAASLLRETERTKSPKSSFYEESTPLAMDRTVKLASPSKSGHLVRKRVYSVAVRVCLIVLLVILGIVLGVALTGGNSNNSESSKTSPPPVSRREAVLNYLDQNGITSMKDLITPGQPQYLAANWMADVDPLQYDTSDDRFVQRYALATFYFAMGGNNWTHTRNFLTAQDECAWAHDEHIDAWVGQAFDMGVTCNANLQVRNLFVPENNLHGEIPSELRHLTNLEMICLPYNSIRGTVPEIFGNLRSLNYLDLKFNDMTGKLPASVGDVENLEVLGFSNNRMTGSVPNNYGTLGRLKTLALDDNAFTGNIKFANYLTNLEFFYADRNLFTGTMDANFLVDLARLRELDLSSNQFTCTGLPQHMLQLPALQVLDLGHNLLGGFLPETLSTNNVLEFLTLRNNTLTGPLRSDIAVLANLKHLDLHGNEFSGFLPNQMKGMTNLNFLFLGDNKFQISEFPSFLYDLKNLHELSMPSTEVFGAIPDWIEALSNLKLLDFSNNFLEGSVPRQLFDLPELAYLYLDHNLLTGNIPTNIVGAENFRIVSLHKNRFSGVMDHVCTEASELDLIAVDCANVTCSRSCCSTCCKADDDDCYTSALEEYMTYYEGLWEYQYTRASYSFDPAILSKKGIVDIVSEEPGGP